MKEGLRIFDRGQDLILLVSGCRSEAPAFPHLSVPHSDMVETHC